MDKNILLMAITMCAAFSAFTLSSRVMELVFRLRLLGRRESSHVPAGYGQDIFARSVLTLLHFVQRGMRGSEAANRTELPIGKLLYRAGVDDYISASCFKPACFRVGAVFGCALALIALISSPALSLLAFGFGLLVGIFGPETMLKERATRFRDVCERETPTMIDIITLSIDAGMSFDAAMRTYVENFDSPLALHLSHAYSRYSQGMLTRDEALHEVAERLDMESFSLFADAVVQALRFGAPLSETLRSLGEDVRREYKAKVAARIAKAPVKMLIPMGTLILPAMLLLVMGPVALNVVGNLV